ncbi:MAG: DNA mismatch endonuclease Vsr [Blastocatellia bacterium]|nr:DNA mismatch endonuclease Vsr [Blastocatellia bacterium]
MPDRITPSQRSQAMSKVRGKDTGIEKTVRSTLHRMGFRFRKNVSSLPGHPDIVLPKYQAVVFVHGCFWHQHPGCPKSRRPASNVDFWNSKLTANQVRDRRNIDDLEKTGWRVFIIWECEIRSHNPLMKIVEGIVNGQENNLKKQTLTRDGFVIL